MQAVRRVVRDLDGLLDIVVGQQHPDRAEEFLLGNLVGVIDVADQRRVHEVAVEPVRPATAGDDGRAALNRARHVAFHEVSLGGPDQRPEVSRLIPG